VIHHFAYLTWRNAAAGRLDRLAAQALDDARNPGKASLANRS
jgi:hypothetical protein